MKKPKMGRKGREGEKKGLYSFHLVTIPRNNTDSRRHLEKKNQTKAKLRKSKAGTAVFPIN